MARYEVEIRQYVCHAETCNHDNHFTYDVWDSKECCWMNNGAFTKPECQKIADSLNEINTNPIKHQISKLVQEVNNLQAQINRLKEVCGHDNVVGEYKSNTGNWCPDDDSYWIEAKCEDCGKYWRIDSKEDDHLYRTFKFKKRS